MNDYSRDSNIKFAETPPITNLLVVGESDTSLFLMQSLINLANFTRIVNVQNCQDAATLLLLENYSVVILDHDAPHIDAISFSRVVRLNHPITRIIVISQNMTEEFIYSLFNQGSIDSFLPMPIDDYTAYSIIIEQQARYEIGDALKQMVKQPPKFTPAYFLLYDQTLMQSDTQDDFEFLGLVISRFSITRFAFFYDNFLTKNESLLSVYMGAITLIGQQLFDQNIAMKEISFGGISIYFHFEGELQFSFLISNLNEKTASKAEELIKGIIHDLINQAFPIISSSGIIVDYQDSLIAEIIDTRVKSSYKTKLVKRGKKEVINFIIYGEPFDKLEKIITTMFPNIKLHYIDSYETLVSHMKEHLIDILVINPIYSQKISNLPLSIHLKDQSPKTQIIGALETYSVDVLLKIIETASVEYVLSYQDKEEQINKYLRKVYEKAYRLSVNTKIPIPFNLRYSFEQSEFTRSLLRMHPKSYVKMSIPKLFGLFIARDNLPFYHKIWSQDDKEIKIDTVLFAGFITSLSVFSMEMFYSSETITGIKFANSSLIIQNLFEYCFVFFTGNLDHSNIPIINKHIKNATLSLYELLSIANSIELGDDLKNKIEQILVELFMKFSLMD